MVRTSDTDVVVLLVSEMQNIGADEVWVAFGVQQKIRYIGVYKIARKLSPRKSKALRFFHSFTGCYVTSSFAGKGKRSAWVAWRVCPMITDVLCDLASQPSNVPDEAMQELERFVAVMYVRTSELFKVNDARQSMFSKGSRSMENTHPLLMPVINTHVEQLTKLAMCRLLAFRKLQQPFHFQLTGVGQK